MESKINSKSEREQQNKKWEERVKDRKTESKIMRNGEKESESKKKKIITKTQREKKSETYNKTREKKKRERVRDK